MTEGLEQTVDLLGAYEAPENRERVFLTPGYRKLKVESFTYEKEEDGKTPCIVMKLTTEDADGNVIELNENLYISGKLNAKKVMTSVIRILELYKGLTGDSKMEIKTTQYSYTKKELNGSSETYTIPNPAQICAHLQKKCTGKTAIFKIGGEIGDDGTVYPRLAYTSFLYWADKKGNLCRYKEEGDFNETEYAKFVQKRKTNGAPTHSNGIADTKKLDDL